MMPKWNIFDFFLLQSCDVDITLSKKYGIDNQSEKSHGGKLYS